MHFKEKITNFNIYLKDEYGNVNPLNTINHADSIPISKDCIADFNLVNVFDNKEYLITLTLQPSGNPEVMLFATRLLIQPENLIKITPTKEFGAINANFNFILTIPDIKDYKITLNLIENNKVIDTASRYYYFIK